MTKRTETKIVGERGLSRRYETEFQKSQEYPSVVEVRVILGCPKPLLNIWVVLD